MSSGFDDVADMSASRRAVLGGLAAFGAGVTLDLGTAPALAAAPKSRRIDVHRHTFPPAYVAARRADRSLTPALADGMDPVRLLQDMDRGGVSMSILSASSASKQSFGDVQAMRSFARAQNEYLAKLRSDHPTRFGMFAATSLPDVEGSLKEIDYAFDVLKADGVALITNYGDKWLGDPAFAPVFDELNRRKAVIYTHPASADCCTGLLRGSGVDDSNIEYGTDTTRAIANVIFGGTSARCPNVKIIWSHAGGTMPFLIERFIKLARTPKFADKFPNGFLPEAQRFYYDTAQTANGLGAPMLALKKVIPVSHIVFGTDFPWRTAAETVKGLHDNRVFTSHELQAIDSTNVMSLLPHLAKV
jgi:predicted TIM-barrel fold metal-dependent hydrolase